MKTLSENEAKSQFGNLGIYPNYFNLHVSELSTDVRARHNAWAMTSPCQAL